MIEEALRQHQLGHLQEATRLYKEILRSNPNSDVAFNLGLAYGALGDLSSAETAYLQALHLEPFHRKARNNLALIHQRQGRLFAAEQLLRALLSDDPWNCDISANLAGILLQQGRPSDGCSILYPCLQKTSFHPIGWDTLGACLLDMGDVETASGCFARAHQQAPNNPEILFHLYGSLYNDQAPQQAIDCLYKAQGLNKERADVRFHLHCLLEWKQASHSPPLCEHRPWMESWTYIKQHRNQRTRLFANTSNTLHWAVQSAKQTGLVAEFGVRFGTTLRLLQKYTNQRVHGFDSFEGLPTNWHEVPQGAYSTAGQVPELGDNILLYPGWFSETLPNFINEHTEPLRLLHIDCDLYSSTIEVLTALSPQIVSGTIIVFDEYIMNPHWQEDEYKAWQEAVQRFGWRYEYLAFSLLSNQAVVQVL